MDRFSLLGIANFGLVIVFVIRFIYLDMRSNKAMVNLTSTAKDLIEARQKVTTREQELDLKEEMLKQREEMLTKLSLHLESKEKELGLK